MTRERRNVLVLATCQMLFNSSRALLAATAPLVAYAIAAEKALATLPTSLIVIGTAVMTLPASLLMQRVGRRAGFALGAAIGAVGGGIAAVAVLRADFWMFCLGTLLFGCCAGFSQLYRFAAADVAAPENRSQAISLVLAGGVVAAFIGPELAKLGKGMIVSVPFLGAYILLMATALLTAVAVSFVDIPRLTHQEASAPRRPLAVIMRQPPFIVATLTAMVGQAVMSLLMTATPIAMALCHHPFADTALVIEWHVVGMYAPGFFTGWLIRVFGVTRIVLLGLMMLGLAVWVALSGQEVHQFWTAMTLLGVGWNFTFTGGTTLLTGVCTPAERAKTQGAANMLIYAVVALASLSSGSLIYYFGWPWVNVGALPLIAVALAAILWHARLQRLGTQPA
jgi:predicted MFS family arabinose efflux permease